MADPLELSRDALILSSRRYTTLARTPWAGRKLSLGLKAALSPELRGQPIGESWEYSLEPGFVSALRDQELDFGNLIDQAGPLFLGEAPIRRHGGKESITLKIIDTDAPLSVQVHPEDDDSALLAHECGKPESWYILDAAPGAGIFLGLKRPLPKADFMALARSGGFHPDLWQFVPVSRGDYFDLAPTVMHAIGSGITLLEPQRVLKAKEGKTYRLWDWDRRYNSLGQPDPQGLPRALDTEAAARLIDSEAQAGPEFVKTLRRLPQQSPLKEGLDIKVYPKNDYYGLCIIEVTKSQTWSFELSEAYALLTVLKGKGQIKSTRWQEFQCGETLFLPSSAGVFEVNNHGPAEFSLVLAKESRLKFQDGPSFG